jgi:hypothetical protein
MTDKKPPRAVGPDRIIHRSYTPEDLNYIGHQLAREGKGEPRETYAEYCDRRAGMKVLTDEELMRRLREKFDRGEPDTTE